MKFDKIFAGVIVGARILTFAVTTATMTVAPFPLYICSDIAIQKFFGPDIKRHERELLSLVSIAAGEGIILLAGALIFFGLDKLREEPPEEE
jgi:hypothetical protein